MKPSERIKEILKRNTKKAYEDAGNEHFSEDDFTLICSNNPVYLFQSIIEYLDEEWDEKNEKNLL